jgi:hypothetical protein
MMCYPPVVGPARIALIVAIAISSPVGKKLHAVSHHVIIPCSIQVWTRSARYASASLYEIRGDSVIILV